MQMQAPLKVNKTAEWCNCFVIVSTPNGIMCHLGLIRLNQALIIPVHRGPTINDIVPELTNTLYERCKLRLPQPETNHST